MFERPRVLLVLAAACLGACADGESDGRRDGGADAPTTTLDAGAVDASALDASALDASALDAPTSPLDAPVSPTLDVGTDAPLPALDAPAGTVDAPLVALDAGPDAGPPDAGPPDAGLPDAGPPDAGPPDAGPPPPPGPGTYLYNRVPLGGFGDSHVVAFHPDGSYALVLERSQEIHVYDWATRTATIVDVRVGGRTIYLEDVAFDPSGTFALVVGYERVGTAETGVVIEVSDALVRSGSVAAAFTRLTETRAGERFTAIEYPPPGDGAAGDGRPFVLSASGTSPYIARVRELSLTTRTFAGLLEARATGAGCDDLVFADNEFGGWGVVLACGINGGEAPYYTQIGGVGEWRPGPFATPGNTSRAASHGSGDYALAVGWSGRRLHRFEAGAWRDFGASPGWTTMAVFDVSFSSDGRRALVVGQAGGSPLRAPVLEYRHDLYSFAAITDVSIAGFASAPYLGTTSTSLNDSAFRPGCDGGILVGGNVSAGTGLLVEFQIEGGVACR